MTATLSKTQLDLQLEMHNFRFEPEELAFFRKHVWSVWTLEQQQLCERVRTAIADLSMHPALSLTYKVELSSKQGLTTPRRELFTFSCGSHDNVFQVMISNNRLHSDSPYRSSLDEVLQGPVMIHEQANAGLKYGDQGEVDFETVSYKARQMLLNLRDLVVYRDLIVRTEDNSGKSQVSNYLALRAKSSGFTPDNESDDQFHIEIGLQPASLYVTDTDSQQAL